MSGAEVLVPTVVPQVVVSLYQPAIIVGLLTGFIGLLGIAFKKGDLSALILTDIVGLAMLLIVAAVATDLAEALILPGLVVELAEILAISEILMSREMRKNGKPAEMIPLPLSLDMEILDTAPTFLAILLIAYGAFLTGFTGGAVAGVGILFYVLSKTIRGVPSSIWEGVAGASGIAWCLWIAGFLLFFVTPQYWLLGLFMSACGILVKVAAKAGLIGIMGREEFKRQK
ncbi:MAG: EhaG family protein [Methanobacterium sp.]|uniref:EhaG family protein n=1 Tax=Methanobacterium sp. TaxID=2164 RepID=UPI003D661487|nr:EhaG family protein [Methanobacterium sp.]